VLCPPCRTHSMADKATLSGESGSDAEYDSSAELEVKVLPGRATRGVRTNELIGEAQEADNAFWNQDIFNEEDHGDSSFSEQSEAATTESSDSDIDEDEPDEESNIRKGATRPGGAFREFSGAEAFGGDDDKGRSSGAYVDPALAQGAKAKVSGFAAAERKRRQNQLTALLGAEKAKALLKSIAEIDNQTEMVEEKGVRDRVEMIKELREKAREAAKSRPSQAQVLVEAADTTIQNLSSLNAMMRLDDLRRNAKRARAGGEAGGPEAQRVRLLSTIKQGEDEDEGGGTHVTTTLTFLGVDSLPSLLLSGPVDYPSTSGCRYRFPGTLEEFDSITQCKQLRKKQGRQQKLPEIAPEPVVGGALRPHAAALAALAPKAWQRAGNHSLPGTEFRTGVAYE
jgi:hypothetical protein